MKDPIVGTWKAVSNAETPGLFKKMKEEAIYTFYENGEGNLKLSFLPAVFRWYEKDGEYFITNKKGTSKLILKGDTLMTCPKHGNPSTFIRVD